ncbi:uncharacterized protein [Scyliorhinus torazame]|uniref:uncharacterized protein isoform X2 n=1 Tax=Scyliorhinus torazame TaxID=75743 RepID=UPI003B59B515
MRWGLLTAFASCLCGLLHCDTGGHDSRQRLIRWRGPLTPRATGRPPNLGPTRRLPDEDGPRPGRVGKIRKAPSSPGPATASRPCAVDGLLLYQGAVWSPQPCTLCACEEGRAVCEDIECLPTTCRRTRTPPGRCCPVCLPDTIPGTIAPASEVLLTGNVPAHRKEGRRELKDRRSGKHGKAAKGSAPGSGRPRTSPEQPGARTLGKGTGKQEPDAEKQAPLEKPRPGRQAPGAATRTRGLLPKVQEVSLRKQGAVIEAGPKKSEVGLKKAGSAFKKPEEGLKTLESGLKRAEVGLKRLEDGLKKLEEGLEKPEVGLKPQKIGLKNKPEVVVEAGLKKPKLGLKKQDIGLKGKPDVVVEAGLKKPKLGLKKQDIGLKGKPDVVVEAGLKKPKRGLKKQDIGLKGKPDVDFRKPEVSLQTLGAVADGGPRQPGAVPEKPEAAGKVAKGAASKKRQEGGPATGAPRQKVLSGRQKAGSGTDGRKWEASPKGQDLPSGGARAQGPAPTKPHGRAKGREAGGGQAARAGKKPGRSFPGAVPPRLAGREEESAAAATSVPFPKELRPPAESEFNMPSLPAGCILAENAIACPSAKLIDIPTLLDPDLHTLYLADNGIKTVSAEDFAGLPNLQWLDLSRNKISDDGLDRNAFQNVSRLRRLNLDGNRILRVPWLPPSLDELKLNDNLLAGLESNSLRGAAPREQSHRGDSGRSAQQDTQPDHSGVAAQPATGGPNRPPCLDPPAQFGDPGPLPQPAGTRAVIPAHGAEAAAAASQSDRTHPGLRIRPPEARPGIPAPRLQPAAGRWHPRYLLPGPLQIPPRAAAGPQPAEGRAPGNSQPPGPAGAPAERQPDQVCSVGLHL